LANYWNVDVKIFYPFIEFIYDKNLIYYALKRFIESGRINFDDHIEIKQIKQELITKLKVSEEDRTKLLNKFQTQKAK